MLQIIILILLLLEPLISMCQIWHFINSDKAICNEQPVTGYPSGFL